MRPPDPQEMLGRALEVPGVAAVVERVGPGSSPPLLLVGGAVRDLLLGRPVLDLDLAVEGPLTPILALLQGELRRSDRFGTATVMLDGVRCDLARTRRERYARPGALPEVEPAPLEEDLRRRDFTVNALAVALTGPGRGRLSHAPQALADLETRALRVLHENSFKDDPTRLLRAARYASRLDFELEPRTRKLAEDAVSEGALETISGARLGSELRLLAQEQDPIAPWVILGELRADQAIFPGFGLRDPALAARALGLLPPDGQAAAVVLSTALVGLAESERRGLLERLSFPAELRDRILVSAGGAERLSRSLEATRRPSEIRDAVVGAGPSAAAVELVALAGALGPEAQAKEWLERLRHVRLQIGGEDLVAAGVPPGPAVGRGLEAARRKLLDGEAGGREEQLEAALRAAGDGG